MENLLLLILILLLIVLPFRIHSKKHLPFFLGLLVFVLVYFLKSNKLLMPITDITNLFIATLIISVATFIYTIYYNKMGAKK